jgi:hypothetical protein
MAVPILIIFIFVFVVPFGFEFKDIKKETKLLEKDLQMAELNQEKMKKELYNLEIEKAQIMHEFKKPTTVKDFQNENPFVDRISYLPNQTTDNKFFTQLIYKVETKQLYSTLDNFFDLLKNNQDFKMQFAVDFPIVFQVDKKRRLKSSFNLNVEQLKPITKELVRPYKDIQK